MLATSESTQKVDDPSTTEVAFELWLREEGNTSLDLTRIEVEVQTGRASVMTKRASASKTMFAALGISAMVF